MPLHFLYCWLIWYSHHQGGFSTSVTLMIHMPLHYRPASPAVFLVAKFLEATAALQRFISFNSLRLNSVNTQCCSSYLAAEPNYPRLSLNILVLDSRTSITQCMWPWCCSGSRSLAVRTYMYKSHLSNMSVHVSSTSTLRYPSFAFSLGNPFAQLSVGFRNSILAGVTGQNIGNTSFRIIPGVKEV